MVCYSIFWSVQYLFSHSASWLIYVYFSCQPNVEMNWNMKKYLPTAASCQSYFQVHLSFWKCFVVYTPSPIAKIETRLLLWRVFPLKGHATFLCNFFTHRDVLSVKSTFFFGGGGGVKVCTFLSVLNISTEAGIVKWATSLPCIHAAAFSLSSWVLVVLFWHAWEKRTLLFIFWCQLLVFLIQLAGVYSLTIVFLAGGFCAKSCSQIRKWGKTGWGVEGREMICLYSRPWVFSNPICLCLFLFSFVVCTGRDILSFVYFL